MARYGKEQKQATRRRIIESAGRRLKRDGIDGSGSPRSWPTPGDLAGAAHGFRLGLLGLSCLGVQLGCLVAALSGGSVGSAKLPDFHGRSSSSQWRLGRRARSSAGDPGSPAAAPVGPSASAPSVAV